mmetsp:Transcript_5060/g.7540  ORF Transcript_5060/g.7540 Transcript_5060/m.7540 type:complete len:204 (-) Transcript_5060:952-1563(-)
MIRVMQSLITVPTAPPMLQKTCFGKDGRKRIESNHGTHLIHRENIGAVHLQRHVSTLPRMMTILTMARIITGFLMKLLVHSDLVVLQQTWNHSADGPIDQVDQKVRPEISLTVPTDHTGPIGPIGVPNQTVLTAIDHHVIILQQAVMAVWIAEQVAIHGIVIAPQGVPYHTCQNKAAVLQTIYCDSRCNSQWLGLKIETIQMQ